MKKKVLETLKALLVKMDEDQRTGFEEGIYETEQSEEAGNLRQLISDYETDRPDIYLLVKGGLIQGASATEKICVNVYDLDCPENDPEYVKNNGTIEEWNNKIWDGMEDGSLVKVDL